MNGPNRNWLADGLKERWLILTISLIVSISFGVTYGDYISNHPIYLLEGLRLSRPDLLTFDWFTNETAQYHRQFTGLVAALSAVGILEWGLAVIHTTVVMTSVILMAVILRLLDPVRYIYAWLTLLVIFIAVDETKSIAASYLFTPALQPSGISAMAYLGAIFFFMRRSYWLSGLSLAIAGLFHTNYLVLSFLFFGCAHLALGTSGIIRRGWSQFLLPLIVLGFELPSIVDTMGLELPQEQRSEAARIFLNNLSQHYLPATFWPSFIPLLGWHMAGSAFFAGAEQKTKAFQQFWVLNLGLVVLLGAATVFSSVIFIETVARLFVLRIAPFSLMFAQMLFALALARMWLGQNRETYAVLARPRIFAASAGLVLVIAYEWATMGSTHTNTLIYGLMLGLVWLAYLGKEWFSALSSGLYSQNHMRLGIASALALLLGASAIQSDFRPNTFSLVCQTCANKAEMELYDWVKTSTETDSLFLVPPKLRGMRLFGERAIVVDAKGIPYDPRNLKEWNRRMALVRRFFEKQDLSQISKITTRYQPDYIVFNKRKNHQAIGDVLFENRRFIVTRAPRTP